jgi:hypothetical protein
MDRENQARIIRELCDGMRESLLERLDRIPEHWNGIQLRLLVADLAAENASAGTITASDRRLVESAL